jgi:hypothetical protein
MVQFEITRLGFGFFSWFVLVCILWNIIIRLRRWLSFSLLRLTFFLIITALILAIRLCAVSIVLRTQGGPPTPGGLYATMFLVPEWYVLASYVSSSPHLVRALLCVFSTIWAGAITWFLFRPQRVFAHYV